MLIERARTCKNFSLCIGGGDQYINMSKLGFKTLGNHNGAFVKKEWKYLNENDANSFTQSYRRIRFLCIDIGTENWLPGLKFSSIDLEYREKEIGLKYSSLDLEERRVKEREEGKIYLRKFLINVVDPTNFTFIFCYIYESGDLEKLLHLFDPVIKTIKENKYVFVIESDGNKYMIISTNDKIGEYNHLLKDEKDPRIISIVNNKINNNNNNDNYIGLCTELKNGKLSKNTNKTSQSYQEILQYIYDKCSINAA